MLVTLTVGCFLLALGGAHPHHLQQLYFQQQQPGGLYYIPQAGLGSVTSVQRYAAPLPVALGAPTAPQYVLLYPGTPQHNFLTGRADGTVPVTQRPTIWNFFNLFNRPTTPPPTPPDVDVVTEPASEATPTKGVATSTVHVPIDAVTTTTPSTTTTTTTVPTNVEETTPKPANEEPPKPEKIVDEDEMAMAVEQAASQMTDEEKESLENLDETLQPAGNPSPDGRQYILLQRPQFFGNYDLLQRPDMQQRFGVPPGAVSDFLHLRNGFAKPGVVQGRPLKMEMGEGVLVPGAAALAFQEEMRRRDAAFARGVPTTHVDVSRVVGIPASQHVYLLGSASSPAGAVVVDAERPKADAEVEQTGPSVAQAKPQAIALAGVGGMAAATPVATAVVGPGGLAVSAPTATAVAGSHGGGSLVGPAQATITAVNKHVNKVNKVNVKDNGYSHDYDRYH